MDLHPYVKKFGKIIEDGAQRGVMCHSGYSPRSGRLRITSKEHSLVDFGTCSYLGLEHHPRLLEAGMRAMQEHGTRVASSRTYLESTLYCEVESELAKIYGPHMVLGTTLTLLHQSAIPVLALNCRDLFIDEYAHASLRTALAMSVYAPKSTWEIVSYLARRLLGRTQLGLEPRVHRVAHNDLSTLEKHLQRSSKECWYFCDGIYSMHGDCAPFAELIALMERYPQLHCYVDDAHSLAITGTHGTGIMYDLVKDRPELAQRCIIGLSFVKGLATAGAGLWVGNPQLKQFLHKLGQTTVFGCALPSSGLGSLVAGVQLMASPEGQERRARLKRNIAHLRRALTQKQLVTDCELDSPSPIILLRFNGIDDDAIVRIVQRLLDAGIYVIPTSYPAVRKADAGLRLVSTSEQRPEHIELLTDILQEELCEQEWREAI